MHRWYTNVPHGVIGTSLVRIFRDGRRRLDSLRKRGQLPDSVPYITCFWAARDGKGLDDVDTDEGNKRLATMFRLSSAINGVCLCCSGTEHLVVPEQRLLSLSAILFASAKPVLSFMEYGKCETHEYQLERDSWSWMYRGRSNCISKIIIC